jgi:LysM repeat protein
MRKYFLSFLSLFAVIGAGAQKLSAEQYIQQYKDVAILEMKRMGVPAAITLAQGILESENGNSDLVKKSNNHFGIKCKNTWTGETVYHDDDASGECFRSYKTAEESFRDHSNFLRNNSRYGFLFKLDAADYRSWAFGLKKAGYATNPQYPAILIKNIEQYNLQQYTLSAADEVPVFDASKFQDDKVDTGTALLLNDATARMVADTAVVSILDVPAKPITINGCKCVMAAQGTSLLVIASRNNIDLAKLLEYNELSEDGILGKTQYVFLEKKLKEGETDQYIVQEGESIYDIAQRNGIQLQYLLDYNHLNNDDKLTPGSKLELRAGRSKHKKDKHPKVKMHTVAPKEGLYAIAKKYNITVQELREWNKLDTDDLKIGQQLIVSQ